ncbi:MAG: hypothetical protein IJG24_03450, partial [Selenomonadaceae bacterium]|nr:hypothetical protein [Selenomonadaceae bacterium]
MSSDISSLNNSEINVGENSTFSATVGDTHNALAINVPLATFKIGTLSTCKAYPAASGCFNDYDPDFKYKFNVNDATANTVTVTGSGGTTTPTSVKDRKALPVRGLK